jgi:UDP-N-acetylmuramate dehydrogenase
MTGWDELVAAGHATRHAELAPLTTYKLGGSADLLVEAVDVAVLERSAVALQSEPLPVLILGRGSNLLIADAGFRGVVIRLGASFSAVAVDADGVVTAGAALSLPRLARSAGSAGRGGLEWCVGVPGSVGGAVRQNAGCFGSEVVDVLLDAEVVALGDGERSVRTPIDLDLAYRHSNLRPGDVVTSARFFTTAVDPVDAAAEMRHITRWRRDNQPGGTLNAGSVFKNPGPEAAGAIIDRLGLKGFAVGKVRVSPRHANFIEAESGASASDVHTLIATVQAKVLEEAGISLEPEIQFVGFGD